MIALLSAVSSECNAILGAMSVQETIEAGSKTFYSGTVSGKEVVLCAGGMGKANAAHAAALLITRFGPKIIVIFGIGGAYPSSCAEIGDIVIASEEIVGDEGVLTPDGFKDAGFIGIPLVHKPGMTLFNRFPAPESLVRKAHDAAASSGIGRRVQIGRFVTLSTCTGTSRRSQEIERMYAGVCENMEGAAAAQVALMHDVPWIELRGISNIVEDRDTSKWMASQASEAAQQAVQALLEVF